MSKIEQDVDALVARADKAIASGDHQNALALYRAASGLEANSFRINFGLASALLATGAAAEAAAAFQRALDADSASYTASLGLALALLHAGRPGESAVTLTQAIETSPGDARAYVMLAGIHRLNGEAGRAEEGLRQALIAVPDSAEIHLELGRLLFERRSFAEAVGHLSRACKAAPGNADAGLQLVAALLNMKEARRALDEAQRLEAACAGNIQLLRMKLAAYKQLDDKHGVQACANAILALAPDDVSALQEILSITQGLEQNDVRRRLHHICRQTPHNIQAWRALAAAAETHEQVIEILEEGIAHSDDPSLRFIRALTLPHLPKSVRHIQETRQAMAEHLNHIIQHGGYRIANPLKAVEKTAWRLAYHGENDRPLMEMRAAAHLATTPDLAWTSPALARKRPPREKIRIGFISAFFEWHSVGRMLSLLIRDLDRSRFEVIVIRPQKRTDEFGETINRSADKVVYYPLALPAARSVIAELDLDILFFADIGMEPFTYYLAFSRLARRQVVWPGHPVTTGLNSFDGIISGKTIEPEDGQSHYTEKLITLSMTPIYESPRAHAPSSDFRTAFNLPKGNLYVCPMTIQKFHPDFDRVIGRILEQDRHGHFAIVGLPGQQLTDLQLRMSGTIPGLAEKLHVLPWLNKQQFGALLNAADATLETLHFGGSGTSRDAAAAGACVVNMDGRYMRGRTTSGLYRDMGLPHLAMRNEDEYVEMALRLANDPTYRSEARAQILDAGHTIVSPRKVLSEFEECFAAVLNAPQ